MKYSILLLSVLFCMLLTPERLDAQRPPEANSYYWEENPKLHVLSDSDKALPELVLFDMHWLEYYYDDDELRFDKLIHKIIYVNSPDAIDRNNKIYLPVGDDMYVIRQKARVIKPDGTVVELNKDAIRQGVDDETNQPYRYFAIDGLEPKSEVEYLLEVKESSDHYGTKYTLQDDIPIRNLDFKLITPTNLLFIVKSFNGLPEAINDTLKNGKHFSQIKLDTLEGVEAEEFAPYRSNLKYVVYKLDKNFYTGKKNLVNYISAAQSVFNITHQELDKPTKKVIGKFIKEAGVSDQDDDYTKARKIETYIKTQIRELEHTQISDDINEIIKNKAARTIGIVRLYSMVFESFGLEYEVVLTTNRQRTRFDEKFESYSFLGDYLIYLPKIDKYIAPSEPFYRIGIIPSGFIYNNGLFIKSFKMGDVVTGIGEVKRIPENIPSSTTHNTHVKLDMNTSLTNAVIDYEQDFSGYYAIIYQPYFDILDETKQKDLVDELLKGTLKTGKFTDIVVENKGTAHVPVDPLILKAKVTVPGLVENAGEKYLFKIGELIGPQAQLYKKNTRLFDIENDFNRIYHREIEFTIPSGYKIGNLEALTMNVVMPSGQEPTSGFVSKVENKGNSTYVVKVDEFYKQIAYPKALYEEYRAVINAAADFNKVVLLIEKQ